MPETYATVEQFRARTGARDITEVTEGLTAQLEAASRIIELEMRVAPDYFHPHDATYFFQTRGGARLYLRDEEGLAYALRSVVDGGIRPDYERSGEYAASAYQWDLGDVWIWPTPRNHEVTGRPIIELELRRVGAAPFTWWPTSDGSVRIEGAWGWG